MSCQRIEKLNQQYAGQLVLVDGRLPELTRFAEVPGRVKAVNHNGRALVLFDGPDRSWHEIELDHLKVVESGQATGEPSARAANSPPVGPKQPRKSEVQGETDTPGAAKLSRLELARLQKQQFPDTTEQPSGGKTR